MAEHSGRHNSHKACMAEVWPKLSRVLCVHWATAPRGGKHALPPLVGVPGHGIRGGGTALSRDTRCVLTTCGTVTEFLLRWEERPLEGSPWEGGYIVVLVSCAPKQHGQSHVLQSYLMGGLGCRPEPGLSHAALCLCPAGPEVGRRVAYLQSNGLFHAVRRDSGVAG